MPRTRRRAESAGADPGGTVTITGTNFILATGPTVDGVSVNGTPAASFVVNSATKITATLPAANSGISSGPITVTSSTVGSATSAASLIVRATPTVSSFLPASGIVGTKVTVFGTNFAGGGITVTFNGDDPSVSGSGAKTATATVLSNTSLTVNVPAGASSGSITVNSATQGSSDNSTDEFFVAIKPVFSPGAFTGDTNNPFDPTSGPASAQASTIVSIHGAHMFGVTNVLFNNKPAAFVSIQDDNGIAAMVPAGATTGKITLVSPAGNTISSGNFTVDAPPSVTTISPSKGAVGDTVTINGNGFIGEMGGDDCGCTDFGTSVDFHGVFNADITGTMTSQVMNVTVPDGAVTGPLLVTDVWGQTALTPQFTVFQPPVIDQFFNEFTNLRSGKKGQPVVIDGAGFTGTTSVKFNGTAASFVVVRDFEIIATVPAGATTGPITVTNPADTATTAPTNFTVN